MRGALLEGWPLATRLPHEDHAPSRDASSAGQASVSKASANKGIHALREDELQALVTAVHTGALRAVREAR